MDRRGLRRRGAHYPLIPGLFAVALLLEGARRLRRVEVVGASMSPALVEGDRLLVLRGARPHRGQVAVLVDPRDSGRVIVKRVTRVGPDSVEVEGDNSSLSSDSRHFGPVERKAVVGRAFYRYHPSDRRGRLGPNG